MPNWCENHLTVTGDPAQTFAFLTENKVSDTQMLSFEKCVPLDQTRYEEIIKSHKGLNSAALQNIMPIAAVLWGTKWDACEPTLEIKEGSLGYGFLTAWSPPVQWLKQVVEPYSRLRFVLLYGECGNDFAGELIIENGEVVSESEGCYRDYYPCTHCGHMDCEDDCEWFKVSMLEK